MERREFIKKAAIAAAGAAVVSPVSAMMVSPKRDERPQFMNFIR